MNTFRKFALSITALVLLSSGAHGAAAYYQPIPSLTKLSDLGANSPGVLHADVLNVGKYDWYSASLPSVFSPQNAVCPGAIDGSNYVAATGVATTSCWVKQIPALDLTNATNLPGSGIPKTWADAVRFRDFGAPGDDTTTDPTDVQAALTAVSNADDRRILRGTGSRISLDPTGGGATGVIDFSSLTWPQQATVEFGGPNYEQVTLLNHFSPAYDVMPGFHRALPVNEVVVEGPYHPGIVCNNQTKVSYGGTVQPAQQFELDAQAWAAGHSLSFYNSSEQCSLNFRKDNVSKWSIIYGGTDSTNTPVDMLSFNHWVGASELDYRLQFEPTHGDVGIQMSVPQYPLQVAGAMGVITDTSTTSSISSDNQGRFGGNPSYFLRRKTTTSDLTSSVSLEGVQGYQIGILAASSTTFDSAVHLQAWKGQATPLERSIYLDGFFGSFASGNDDDIDLGRSALRWKGVYGYTIDAKTGFAVNGSTGVTKTCTVMPTSMTIAGGIIVTISGGTCS